MESCVYTKAIFHLNSSRWTRTKRRLFVDAPNHRVNLEPRFSFYHTLCNLFCEHHTQHSTALFKQYRNVVLSTWKICISLLMGVLIRTALPTVNIIELELARRREEVVWLLRFVRSSANKLRFGNVASRTAGGLVRTTIRFGGLWGRKASITEKHKSLKNVNHSLPETTYKVNLTVTFFNISNVLSDSFHMCQVSHLRNGWQNGTQKTKKWDYNL